MSEPAASSRRINLGIIAIVWFKFASCICNGLPLSGLPGDVLSDLNLGPVFVGLMMPGTWLTGFGVSWSYPGLGVETLERTSLFRYPASAKEPVVIHQPDHFTIVTDQLEATRSFYVHLLGMSEGPRPPFPVPGLWLYVHDHPVLHVVAVSQMPTPRRGALDHMAYGAEGLTDTVASLRAHGVPLRLIRSPGAIRTWQLFFNDPNGVEVELDFAETESPPEDWKTLSAPLRQTSPS